MSEDHFTKPERAYQRMQGRRLASAIERLGLCFACRFRDQEEFGPFNMAMCRYPKRGEIRMSLHCQQDNRDPKFTYDDDTLDRLRDGKLKL